MDNNFVKNMVSDSDALPQGLWSRARNATNVTPSTLGGALSNEQSNLLCSKAPYTIIGLIHLYEDTWAVLSTDDTNSEIGIFEGESCKYTAAITDPCPVVICNGTITPNINFATPVLNFNRKNLIRGISKENFDCTWQIYFADDLNPDRTVNLGNPKTGQVMHADQFVQCCNTQAACLICTPTCKIDPERIRLASLIDSPCVKVSKSRTGGTLPNGSYIVTLAYTINSQRVTDYFPISNTQSLFSHANLAGAIDISFSGLDTEHFTEFELVVIRTVNQQTTCKKMGIYSTHTQSILIDNINESLPTVPIEYIPIRTPVYERSEAIYQVGDYALRSAPVSRFDFNYQPLANRITAKWVSVEYASDYYYRGGNNPSLMRDEIYPFFIRWVYTTGDRSSSYHIPGRAPLPGETNPNNTIDSINPGTEREFEVNNTASVTGFPGTILPDGGVVIAEGNMAYWESTEIYPLDRSDIWNATAHPWSNISPFVDLCGKPIRHHKMPDDTIPNGSFVSHINAGGTKIRVLGVKFDNIRPPVDNNGVPIPGIVGWEILRGSREGNKTIIAKGIINNMRGYTTINNTPGAYQNYPYNYLGPDPTLRTQESLGGWTLLSGQPGSDLTDVKNDLFTFHSPDTQFKHPFLAVNELKLYDDHSGVVTGNFEEVPGHPREKLLTDLAFVLAAILGVAEVILALRGQRIRKRKGPYVMNTGEYEKVAKQNAIGGNSGSGAWTAGTGTYTQTANSGGDRAEYEHAAPNDSAPSGMGDGTAAKNAVDAVMASVYDPLTGSDSPGAFSFANLLTLILGGADPKDDTAFATLRGVSPTPGVNYYSEDYDTEIPKFDYMPNTLRVLNGVQIASYYWTLGTDATLRLIEAIVPYTQYAFRYRSHGFYNNLTTVGAGSRRYLLPDTLPPSYLESHRQDYAGFEVNNLYRAGAVILKTARGVPNPAVPDTSLRTIASSPGGYANPTIPFTSVCSSYYTAIIQRFKNQYGQIDSVQQIPVGCKFDIDPLATEQKTSEIFAGDIYIARYTEKNTFFYFYDWLYKQPDGYEYNYKTRYMITYPRYWADFTRYDAGEFLQGITSLTLATPSDRAALDGNTAAQVFLTTPLGIRFRIKNAYFYVFQSGVRDFFVESEVNTALRDWGELPEERHYDSNNYTSTSDLFDTAIIKASNYYKYDYSLSISRLFTNFISWGNVQPRDYDPLVAEKCYIRRPNRLIYSLPQNLENKKDYWRVYLANNYKDFYSRVSGVKPINKNGAVITFRADSPIMFQGVDTLNTDLGTKITVGDGGLFSQPNQSVSNTDVSHEYGSCQDGLSVVNTPFGLFYMCTNQGKVFSLTNQLDDITYKGTKQWFKEYLPFKLLEDFPTFEVTSNPVMGIGCQSVYDNQTETVYFCKKDYKLIAKYAGTIIYNGGVDFTDANGAPFKLGDPLYFQDASFTISYDPKQKGWISFHDWHPDLTVPSRSNFLTTKDNGLWRHNQRRDSFCNFYGVDYPFEVEWIDSTGIQVTTMRNIEYYLECYKYSLDTLDKFHLLDYNFDQAVIYNSEQTSGPLNLVLTPKNDPWGRLNFPFVDTLLLRTDILYSKEEQKYRFQPTGDITDDRGEFTGVQRLIWNTDPNGYTRSLNPVNLNFAKSVFEKKKYRSYINRVSLVKQVSKDINMVVKVAITKQQLSMR